MKIRDELEATRIALDALDRKANTLLSMLHRAYKGLGGSRKQGVPFLMADIECALLANGIDPRSPVRAAEYPAEMPSGGTTGA